jgi:HEPN domain-containing protein
MPSAKLAQILLLKGRQDQHAMNWLLEDSSVPDEIIGFHAQQAVEKMIKAVLAHHTIEY